MKRYEDWQEEKCPECEGKRRERRLVLKPVEGENRKVPCQNPFHGERTTKPGELGFDDQGTPGKMPD
jgi:hypothetical protein